MVSLPKIVLDVVVFGWDSHLDEFVFECAALLKKAMHLAFDFHCSYLHIQQFLRHQFQFDNYPVAILPL